MVKRELHTFIIGSVLFFTACGDKQESEQKSGYRIQGGRFAETPLINYEGRYSYGDHLTLRLFCRLFGVSKPTASIPLRQLGYMVDSPFSEYVDPLEVW